MQLQTTTNPFAKPHLSKPAVFFQKNIRSLRKQISDAHEDTWDNADACDKAAADDEAHDEYHRMCQ